MLRGYRRLGLRVFAAERRCRPSTPMTLRSTTRSVCSRRRSTGRTATRASSGTACSFEVTPAETGIVLDRAAAARGDRGRRSPAFSRKTRRAARRRWTAAGHRRPISGRLRRRAARVVSAPVTLRIGVANFDSPRRAARVDAAARRSEGPRSCSLGGPAANAYFRSLDRRSAPRPRTRTSSLQRRPIADLAGEAGPRARRATDGGGACSRPRSAPARGSRPSSSRRRMPERSTAAARAMGITGLVGSYETIYGGIANRIHNVQLVAQARRRQADRRPARPSRSTRATGERTADKGFLEAPVIINGELSTGLGGGICQVSTTVFNAAYEAGLPITSRTNHALYISHYPLGRDATVDYPNIDLKFVNDTPTLAAAPHVRRLVVARRDPLRHAAAPARRDRDGAAARGRAGAAWRRRSTSRLRRGSASSTSTAFRRRRRPCAGRSTRRAASSSRTRPGTSNYRSEPRIVADRAEEAEEAEARRPSRRRRRAGRHADGAERLRSSDRGGEPRRDPGRPQRRRVDGPVHRPAVRDRRAVALDDVLEAEARAAHGEAARVDEQPVVEDRR